MPLHGHVFTGQDGMRGFDTDVVVSPSAASAFFDHGYRFCVRYVARQTPKDTDLTATEASALLDAGLGLMVVQHVEAEDGWTPDGPKGVAYGTVAAQLADQIGIPAGVNVWLDLEGVAVGTPSDQIVDYCNKWHSAVAAAGFVPGLYVGWRAGLNPSQLYRSLRFTHYWGSYNLNSDQVPAVRGLQMKQAACRPIDCVAGFDAEFQTDVVYADELGGQPLVLAPDGWLE